MYKKGIFSKLKIHVLLLSILLVFDQQKNTGRLTKNAKLNKQNNTLPNKPPKTFNGNYSFKIRTATISVIYCATSTNVVNQLKNYKNFYYKKFNLKKNEKKDI